MSGSKNVPSSVSVSRHCEFVCLHLMSLSHYSPVKEIIRHDIAHGDNFIKTCYTMT